MKPFQPRLLRESRAARRWVGAVSVAGLASAGLAILIAVLLSGVLAGAVQGRESLAGAATPLILIGAVAAIRGAIMSAAEYAGHLAAREVITSLRSRLLHSLAGAGPGVLKEERSGAIAAATTTGIETLDVYFARYLPQLFLGTAIPVMVLLYLAANDVLSTVIVAVTLPLIPLFMWLVGAAAQQRMNSRWVLLQRLGAYFLDVIQGLPTLRIFNRAEAQVERIRSVTEAARRATMGTLAIAFLSSFVLETLASIATALVAAEIGLRLVDGSMSLQTGLAVLVVVPEAYMPLRQLGTFYHASMEGLSAAGSVLDLAERAEAGDLGAGRAIRVPDLAVTPISFTNVSHTHGEREEGVVRPLNFSLAPGTTTLLTGASGAGKSTLLDLLVPFVRPTTGSIQIGDADLRDLDLKGWHARVAWVPQHPSLFAGTVLDNLILGNTPAGDDSAAGTGGEHVDAAALIARLFPDRTIDLHTPLTANGEGLSGGERTRIALARALLRCPQLLLLDEPTAFLDPRSALAVVAALQLIAATTTLVVATHDPEQFPWADQIIDLTAGRIETRIAPTPARNPYTRSGRSGMTRASS